MDRHGELSQPPPQEEDQEPYMTRASHFIIRQEFCECCQALETRQDEQFGETQAEFKNIDNRFDGLERQMQAMHHNFGHQNERVQVISSSAKSSVNVAKPLRRDKMNNLARRKPSSRTSTTASMASKGKCKQCITTSATKMSRFNAPSPKQMTIFDASSTEWQDRVHVLQDLQVLCIVMHLRNKIYL